MPTPRRSLSRLGSVLLASALALTACNAAAPLGSGSDASAPSAPAKATAAIDTAAGIRYAKAAVTALNKDPFVAHVEQVSTATQEANGKTVKMVATMSADFAGKDMGVELTATGIGLKIDLRLRVVGKKAYVFQSGMWLKAKRSPTKAAFVDLIDAVRVIKDPNDLQYLGMERVGKKDLHHFRANRELAYESGLGFQGHYDSFEIWVKADGTPVRFEATYSAEDRKVGKVTGHMVVDFTKFGGSIKVKVPKNKN